MPMELTQLSPALFAKISFLYYTNFADVDLNDIGVAACLLG
uniref:Uncharacterized protein n=1 Tax=Mycetohabitans sp. TaxID=2571162 RepID=A0A6B9HDV2_9BURK|nr:hypothetical protein [Mycetohabitans sp.]